jgi:acetyltransferase-like isoleucine patch superfamily enzyme
MIDTTATVKSTFIGENIEVREYAVIRENVIIGKNVRIHPHVVIEPGVRIGDNVEVFPGAYIGKEPKGAGATAKVPEFERTVVIGSNCSIGPNAVIYYDVEIGQNTLIGDGASIREKCKIGSYCIISRYVTVNYGVTIGDRTKVMDLTHITGDCRIGDDVFISLNVGMTNDNALGRLEYDPQRIVGPVIEDQAAIGAGATILPGVRVGKGAIVGAGALVTKDVPPSTLAMGIPARTVRILK